MPARRAHATRRMRPNSRKDKRMYEDLKLYINGEFTAGNSGAGTPSA